MIGEGADAGRIKDIVSEMDDDLFRDTCCNQTGGDCSRYQNQRPLVPVGRADATRCKQYYLLFVVR